jgi:hypothetical protein
MVHQAALDKYACKETKILEGTWPGCRDTTLLTRFVEVHFAGSWEGYLPFADRADRRSLESPEAVILIQDWRVLKTGSWKEGGRQQLTKEGHSPLDDSDRWRDRDEAEYDHHLNLHRKSKEADSVKTIIRANKSRITTPSVATAGFGGVTLPVAKRLFAPGCKTPQVYSKAAGGQQDICTMLLTVYRLFAYLVSRPSDIPLNGVSTYEFSDSSGNAVISDVLNGLESQKQKRQKEGTAYISRNSSRTVHRPGYLLDEVGAQVEKKRGHQKGGKLKG